MTKKNSKARIRVEYEVDHNGAVKLIELPFVMGVMADLAGDSQTEYATRPVAKREFKQTDAEEFGALMKAIEPRAKGSVKYVLPANPEDKDAAEDREMSFDLKFRSMADFLPDKIAMQIPELKQLLQMRSDLDALLGLMDGRPDAEKNIAKLLSNKPLLTELLEKSAAQKTEGKS